MSLPTHHRKPSSTHPVWHIVASIPQRLSRRGSALPALAITVSLLLFLHLYSTRTAISQLIPTSEYRSTLDAAIRSVFPESMAEQLFPAFHIPYYDSKHDIPNRLWQTDVSPPPINYTRTWDANGFERIFLNDTQAAQWVTAHFGDSEVARVYLGLPLPILKADMLRYLVLLAEGGVYSDADTYALKPLKHWAELAKPWAVGVGTRPKVKMIVGIEGDFHIWRDGVSFAEGVGLTKSGRHRGLQFVQWTIASQSSHPILVDTIRRIVETNTVARAYEIQLQRNAQALEAEGGWSKAQQMREAKRPWEIDLKGDLLSVQEWTGPAVFTDAVLSYLLAVSGVRDFDLYGLNHPVQIADVVILPMDGFNPRTLPNPTARVIHQFRGSWKEHWHWPFAVGDDDS